MNGRKLGVLIAATLVVASLLTSSVSSSAAAVEHAVAARTGAAGGVAPAALPNEGRAAPIVVLMDTSGSMDDDDGSGLKKLVGAERAVTHIVETLGSSTVFGFATYPGDRSCDGVRWVIEASETGLLDPDSAVSRVREQKADGGTPTGPALQAVADRLREQGYWKATIVLVSDGLSTCGTPPCEVATALVADGFDVTVPTVGFRTSDEGAAELSCVAEATGAKSYQAGDSEELDDTLAAIVQSRVSLDVQFDPNPLAGGSLTIAASVQHVGGRAAADVRMTLVFGEADDERRAGIPPQVSLGTLADGNSGSYTWTVGAGVRGETRTVPFTVRVWGTNLAVTEFTGEYTTRPPFGKGADLGAVLSGVDAKHPLVVFGDSYSSGEGTGSYLDVPAGISPKCHRSASTTMGAVVDASALVVLACSGAVMTDLTQPSERADRSQLGQFDRLGIVPGAAILTFGGNDIGFAAVVTRCLLISCDDQGMLDTKAGEVADLQAGLELAYQAAWARVNTPALVKARDGAYAPVVVLPYPKILHRAEYGACYQFSHGEVIVAETLGRELGAVADRAVRAVQSRGFEVYFAAPVIDAVRPDHTLCEAGDEAFINGLIPPGKSESVHPKASGYEAMTDALIGWSRATERIVPDVAASEVERLISIPEVRRPGPPTPVVDGALLVPGQRIRVDGSFEPNSPVTVVLNSDPRVLGTMIVDADGTASGDVGIPLDAQLGAHRIHVSGFTTDGEFVARWYDVSVIAETQLWVHAATVSSGVAILAAGVLFVVARRRHRLEHPSSVEEKVRP
ncbi:VWA domain-containing protein [Microbacterium sp. W4I20]|uniref:VWA domain-containing protein n=1 Tax=Microbacterium sp. W4I20 TaxID=3042262 RepID=UPI0027886C19|nr:VWA domain-containing protein [Microbacterium sp. W4I20]MDQ0725197.1 lysophospholipase L1-like esterase [Microbacterium sp. W4I20]